MKGRTVKVRAVVKDRKGQIVENATNPYRQGSAKFELMDWAMQRGEFTKSEFMAAVAEALEEGIIQSVMPPERCGIAWWNEFFGKYGVFVPVESEEQTETTESE